MGCPAKKICNTLSGSALLKDPLLVKDILTAVVAAVDIPVTLKIRTGWSPEQKNGVLIAQLAESIGIQALAVHGRTRSCFFKGEAEYNTIAAIKAAVNIPVFANGDITSPEKAKEVLDYTKCDAVMIGRAAQGNPWIFREINHYLQYGEKLPVADNHEIVNTLKNHLVNLYNFYGEQSGALIARKHVGWYTKGQQHSAKFRVNFNALTTPMQQVEAINNFFAI
jgi:tRNA-dihydrouridine synthase B